MAATSVAPRSIWHLHLTKKRQAAPKFPRTPLLGPTLSSGTTNPNGINSIGDIFGVYGTTFV